MKFKMERKDAEKFIKENLPVSSEYDEWIVFNESDYYISAKTLFTFKNHLGNNKYATIYIKFPIGDLRNFSFNYSMNPEDVREFIEENKLDEKVIREILKSFKWL